AQLDDGDAAGRIQRKELRRPGLAAGDVDVDPFVWLAGEVQDQLDLIAVAGKPVAVNTQHAVSPPLVRSGPPERLGRLLLDIGPGEPHVTQEPVVHRAERPALTVTFGQRLHPFEHAGERRHKAGAGLSRAGATDYALMA